MHRRNGVLSSTKEKRRKEKNKRRKEKETRKRRERRRKKEFRNQRKPTKETCDPYVTRTRNLRNWSPTRYQLRQRVQQLWTGLFLTACAQQQHIYPMHTRASFHTLFAHKHTHTHTHTHTHMHPLLTPLHTHGCPPKTHTCRLSSTKAHCPTCCPRSPVLFRTAVGILGSVCKGGREEKKRVDRSHDCACHPCAGAMLIFSVY